MKEKNGESVLRFADIEILRYECKGFETLPLRKKLLIYHLSQATLQGRDIIWDQNGRYGLRIRKLLEEVFVYGLREDEDLGMIAPEEWQAFDTYLYRVWFASGIHHHYGSEKFTPLFTANWLRGEITRLQEEDCRLLAFSPQEVEDILSEIFDPERSPKRTEQSGNGDLVQASAVNFYDEGLSQQVVEEFYQKQANEASEEERVTPPSYGLNSRLAQTEDGTAYEMIYRQGGLYTEALEAICLHLEKALEYTDTEAQARAIRTLIEYYKAGDLGLFNRFCIEWVEDTAVGIDFINGFTETYTDPLGLKGSWEGIVHIRNEEASKRTEKICREAAWFETNAPIDPRFRKAKPVGISASVVSVAMLGGDAYPATPIGINLPNADWIRAKHGSKSVTIDNIHEAYRIASKHSGMDEAFVADEAMRRLLARYDGLTDELHTDLHECLGHGSGQLLEGVSPEALGAYGSCIEEARADLFALYYMADDKLIELELLPDKEAYKACYYRYLLNGLVTQLVRIKLGSQIEEAHMRNRALIARYALERGQSEGTVSLEGLSLSIHDYEAVRGYFAELLAEIQRIKSEGDQKKARTLVERYAIHIDRELHREILERYERLNIAPYRGFVNPRYELVFEGESVCDVRVDLSEGYAEQMLRYSREYATLPLDPVSVERLRNPNPSEETLATAREIRQGLRSAMDGVIASSMREKGLHYGINFGLTLEHIQRKVKAIESSKELSLYLLSRDVRELRLMGLMLMPNDGLDFSSASYLAQRFAENPELRDCLCKFLLERSPDAPRWAMAWIDNGEQNPELLSTAYITLARAWMREALPLSFAQHALLMDSALQTLGERSEHITSAQRSALLMLKRWLRADRETAFFLSTHPLINLWRESDSPLEREFAEDLSFELGLAVEDN